jgi:hypothetical protein
MIQCVNVPIGASGSSQISAKLFVFVGAPLHCNGGETSSPCPVYLSGIVCPSWNAVLLNCIFAAPVATGSVPFEQPETSNPAIKITVKNKAARMVMI